MNTTDRTYPKGRKTTGWKMGERITSLDQLKVGDILISDSHQFLATNLIRVDAFRNYGTESPVILDACYVEQDGTPTGEREFAFWPYEFDDSTDSRSYTLYRAVRPHNPSTESRNDAN